MSPLAISSTNGQSNGDLKSVEPSNDAPLEPGISKHVAAKQMPKYPGPPKFEDKYEEREYLKGRLTAALRIFGKLGFEEGIAGHITVRGRLLKSSSTCRSTGSKMVTEYSRRPRGPRHFLGKPLWSCVPPDATKRSD